MSKRGQFYPYRVRFVYPNGVNGVMVLGTMDQVNSQATELLGRGASVEVVKVDPDGSRRTIARQTAERWLELHPVVDES